MNKNGRKDWKDYGKELKIELPDRGEEDKGLLLNCRSVMKPEYYSAWLYKILVKMWVKYINRDTKISKGNKWSQNEDVRKC